MSMSEQQEHAELPFFRAKFEQFLGFAPMPWQEALFVRFIQNELPSGCDIPTGLGKTAVMAIWLIALARQAQIGPVQLPRRLVYVVNRRTVVDQATCEAEQMAQALGYASLGPEAHALRGLAAFPSGCPLAVSTLRGQFADNGEWRLDPSRPAIIVGTVDMIGSRLLFSGYGCGFKSKPLHAGFLGQDSLIVHDEAHLEPAFQKLIESIESEQQRCGDMRPLRVLALTATSRARGGAGLTDAERNPGCVPDPPRPLREVWKRITAKKGVNLHAIKNTAETGKTAVPTKIAEIAKGYESSHQAILVFARRVEHVQGIAGQLPKGQTKTLTGTMRGYERDRLARTDPVFARFLRQPPPGVVPQTGTVYLVCTSAGEVGVNITADHLVSDLTPFDSMAQRLGRVNRFGDGDAQIDVVHDLDGPPIDAAKSAAENGTKDAADGVQDNAEGNTATTDSIDLAEEQSNADDEAESLSPFDVACTRTLRLLTLLEKRGDGRLDASPLALSRLDPTERQLAFTPPPAIPAATDILFDTWALTSVRGKMPGRPPVADWLHGIVEREEQETHVAWREEVGMLSGRVLQQVEPNDLLDDYPLKPHELLRDRTDRIERELKGLGKKAKNLACPLWIRDEEGSVVVKTLADVIGDDSGSLAGMTVVLPPELGGLGPSGMLDAKEDFDQSALEHYDVADKWLDEHGAPRRTRVWDDEEPPPGMRQVSVIDCRPEASDESEDEEEGGKRWWRWFVQPRSADDDGSQAAAHTQDLPSHLAQAAALAESLVGCLVLKDPVGSGIVLAAGSHDRGKHRAIWQRAVGNRNYPDVVLAKPAGKVNVANLSNYRHELGSLLDIQHEDAFRRASPEVQELVLHFVASHHGRARPHFLNGEAFDSERPEDAAVQAAIEAPQRFARLQRRFGRWGLAYLESLLRAADALASQEAQSGPGPSVEPGKGGDAP